MQQDPADNEIRLNARLDSLLAAYRKACPDPEPGADFLARLWQKIEARKSPVYSFRRWAQALLTTAAALCLLFSLLITTMNRQPPAFYRSTYLEVLAAENPTESFPEFELVSTDYSGGDHR